MTQPASYRSRAHGLLLYPDCPAHVKALELLQTSFEHLYICMIKIKMIKARLKSITGTLLLKLAMPLGLPRYANSLVLSPTTASKFVMSPQWWVIWFIGTKKINTSMILKNVKAQKN